MAMNKKELVEIEQLKTLLALRHYPKIEPDIAIPDSYDKIINGYLFNSYSMTVSKACTSRIHHSIGNWDKTTSQKPRMLYSTQKLAYAALLHELSMRFAHELREAEKKFEECEE